MKRIGVVARLARFPVKGMAGESMERACIGYSGIVGDRLHALELPDREGPSRWLTGRQAPAILRYRARLEREAAVMSATPRPEELSTLVATPSGGVLRVSDPALIEELRRTLGHEVRWRSSERGIFDSRPLSLIGEATIEHVGRASGQFPDARRFRSNLEVCWSCPDPFREDALLDERLMIGDRVILWISKRSTRCNIINIDPDTARADPSSLSAVGRLNTGSAGVYAVVLREGFIARGDPVWHIP